MTIENNKPCPIWGANFQARVRRIRSTQLCHVDSPRAGGAFIVSCDVVEDELERLSAEQKARLTTWLVDQRILGNESPEITTEVAEYARKRPPAPAHERADRLLRFLAKQSERVGDEVHLQLSSRVAEKVRQFGATDMNEDALLALRRSDSAAAWSDSTTFGEIRYLLDFLQRRAWLVVEKRRLHVWERFDAQHHVVNVTVDGHSRIADQVTNVDSSQAFVAMWFDESLDSVYEQAIEPAIKDAGYSALRIDRKPDVDKIDDEIIAEIRRSRFVVADFTHGDKGARGGVYFEAGFAYGLGKPVIYTCRNDMVDELHFDTRQYAHILWETENTAQLRADLRNRIVARIGEGPGVGGGHSTD